MQVTAEEPPAVRPAIDVRSLEYAAQKIREHIDSLNLHREHCLQWAIYCKKSGQTKRLTQGYIISGEQLGDKILVLEAELAAIRRVLDSLVDEGWDS